MSLGFKSMLLMAASYCALIAAAAVGIDRWLRAFESEVTLKSATVLARETAAMLSERTYSALQIPDARSKALLRKRLEDLALLSDAASAITVLDAEGRVLASDRWPAGQQLAPPTAVFREGWVVRARVSPAPRFLRGGDYLVDVPMIDRGSLAGYIEVEFHSEKVAELFGGARRRLVEAAFAGLAGVALLGGFLQFQITRRARAIAETLEAAVPDAPTAAGDRGDELARVAKAAGRLRQEVTDARRETTRLEESFSALAQVFQMGVLRLRGDSEPDFANPRALELLGVESLDGLGTVWPAVRPVLERVLSGSGEPAAVASCDVEVRPGRKLRIEPYRLGGAECDEFLVLLNDPDLLDSLETDIRLANQLQGMARVYRTVAHEVRAPLSAMMIHLDLLRESLVGEGAEDADKENQNRYVVVLRDELERLNRSLSEALTQTLPSPDPHDRFDLREALAELGTLLAPQCRRQGVELEISMPEVPVLLVGHRDRLKQTFLNISVNALEAMPQGGSLGLRMCLEGGRVRITFEDDGRGIPTDILERIYERDFTTKGSGSGIGLYVARTLVEMHGGEIRTQSREGSGTKVEVVLPILPRSPDA